MATGERDGLRTYLDEAPGVRPLQDWIWGLARWGKPVLVRAALAVAEACVDRWRRGAPRDEGWQRHFASSALPEEALVALRAWLERGAPPGDAGLVSCTAALRDLMGNAEFYDDEAMGGGAEREQAVASGRAILMALESSLWTVERAIEGVPDEAERQAIARSGPAPELWEAVRAYRHALPDRSETTVRELIRDGLR
ncbi:hypothetical protein BO221_15560 [Archangium sp. Cb G35]|uniref:hypothetical protein n=1 Tax=Archangium sp. Cb G35 TaxID=1920190 RepID=UPI0009369653|nr:hypothetical protein [Archangium sp. Cb G35]OJT24562.1 hypothetical protein BO221_15560 [Archangium sp. Cb G35]